MNSANQAPEKNASSPVRLTPLRKKSPESAPAQGSGPETLLETPPPAAPAREESPRTVSEKTSDVPPAPSAVPPTHGRSGKSSGASAAPTNPLAEKVRHFWNVTGMTDKEFGDLVDTACREESCDFDDGLSDALIRRVLSDYAKKVCERDPECGKIVNCNLEEFLRHDKSSGVLVAFSEALYSELVGDRELQFSMLLNFVRSVLRNDFVSPRREAQVSRGPGSAVRIWQQAYEHYFSKEPSK